MYYFNRCCDLIQVSILMRCGVPTIGVIYTAYFCITLLHIYSSLVCALDDTILPACGPACVVARANSPSIWSRHTATDSYRPYLKGEVECLKIVDGTHTAGYQQHSRMKELHYWALLNQHTNRGMLHIGCLWLFILLLGQTFLVSYALMCVRALRVFHCVSVGGGGGEGGCCVST